MQHFLSLNGDVDVETVLPPATKLPIPISEARSVPIDDTFLLVGGRRYNLIGDQYKGGTLDRWFENAEIYKFELEAPATTVLTELISSGNRLRVVTPISDNGSWKKLPQKTRTPRYTGM